MNNVNSPSTISSYHASMLPYRGGHFLPSPGMNDLRYHYPIVVGVQNELSMHVDPLGFLPDAFDGDEDLGTMTLYNIEKRLALFGRSAIFDAPSFSQSSGDIVTRISTKVITPCNDLSKYILNIRKGWEYGDRDLLRELPEHGQRVWTRRMDESGGDGEGATSGMAINHNYSRTRPTTLPGPANARAAIVFADDMRTALRKAAGFAKEVLAAQPQRRYLVVLAFDRWGLIVCKYELSKSTTAGFPFVGSRYFGMDDREGTEALVRVLAGVGTARNGWCGLGSELEELEECRRRDTSANYRFPHLRPQGYRGALPASCHIRPAYARPQAHFGSGYSSPEPCSPVDGAPWCRGDEISGGRATWE